MVLKVKIEIIDIDMDFQLLVGYTLGQYSKQRIYSLFYSEH